MNQHRVTIELTVGSELELDPIVVHEHLWQFLEHFRPVTDGAARTTVQVLRVEGEPG